MTTEELQTTYKRLYRFIQSERFMRDIVFKDGDPRRAGKLKDADQAMADATALKDALKALMPAEAQQAALLDVPSVRKEFA